MTYRKLAAFGFVWAAVFVVVILLLPESQRPLAYLLEMEAAKALAATGCFIAAFTFGRGEYMRRAWSFNAWCYLLLLLRDVILHTLGTEVGGLGGTMAGLTGSIVLIANFCSVFGTWLAARAWSIAGLELPGPRPARYGVMAVAALIAIAISGSDLYVDARVLMTGNLSTLHSVGSDLGDIFGLCLIAPILLTAIAMRGGVLKWPWGLLTTSLIFWLFYDGISTVDHLVPGHPAAIKLLRETCRAIACTTEFAAGLAQRRAITEPTPDSLIDEAERAS